MLGLVLVALAGGGENVRFWRRRLRLRGLGPGSLYSFLEKRTKTLKEEGAVAKVS